jgi:hypothetical protein
MSIDIAEWLHGLGLARYAEAFAENAIDREVLVFGRLAGYEDVNDAERLCRDPAMRWVVGDRAITGSAASASQMGRFETKWLSRPENLPAGSHLYR